MGHRASWAAAVAVLLNAAAAEAQPDEVFKPSPLKQHLEVVDASSHSYEIAMGGTVDMDRALTRKCSNIKVAFQPNVSLTIANTGRAAVVNPWIVIGDRGNWRTLDEMLAEALRGAKTDQDKVYLIWDFVRRNRHHDDPIYHHDELHDPVRFLCIYGGGLCDDAGSNGSALYHRAGFTAERVGRDPKVRCLHGHMMCEVFLDGNYQFMDIDEDVFYLDRENRKPVSGDAVARDHDLARRELHYGPPATSWTTSQAAASLFGDDDGTTRRIVSGHRMDLSLRPGERLVYRWDNCGKLATGAPGRKFRYWGNSKLIFEPLLDKDYALCCEKAAEVTAVDGGIAGRAPGACLVYAVRSPYTICGGKVAAEFRLDRAGDRAALAFSLDGRSWKEVRSGERPGELTLQADLDGLLEVHQRPPKRAYYIRVGLAGARLEALRIETDVVASPLALPRLRLGRNKIVYRDRTETPHQVTITHQWRESSAIEPPAAPSEPVYPKPGALCRDSILTFRWPVVEGAELYHLQVSRRRDMRLPYRPSFDRMHKTNRFGVPFTGIFSPGEVYYWRVRCRDRHGIWGDWGPTWSFSWEGPRVPVNLRRAIRNQQITLHWEPNPRGPRPVRYEVYGSDEKGFSISKEPHVVQGLGRVEGNFVGATEATQIRVVAPQADKPNMNKAFYRVVAVDAHGTQSGCSDYLEMPHPFICSQPPATAKVGKPYRHQVRTLASLGDYQHRYEKPNKAFWQRERCRFELLEGPAWLKLDAASGVLSGQPGGDDVGQHKVTVRVANPSDGHAAQSFLLSVD